MLEREVINVKRRQVIWRLLAALAAIVAVCPVPARAQAPAPATDDVACQHLFMMIADGPRALSWAAREGVLKPSGMSEQQMGVVMAAADAYVANVSRLTSQATAIHRNLKAKAINQAVAIAQLHSLDEQRSALLTAAMQQLQTDLGQPAWTMLTGLLNSTIKPTITMVQ